MVISTLAERVGIMVHLFIADLMPTTLILGLLIKSLCRAFIEDLEYLYILDDT